MTHDPREPASPHDLLAAYALDAVDEHEQRLFEEHLLGCPACERELAELAPTVEALGAGVPAAPPATVRETVLRHVAEERLDRTSPAPGAGPADDLAARRAARSSRRLVLLAAAAAAVAVVMALVVGPFRAEAPLTPAAIAAAADAERYEVRVGEATAVVIVSRTLDKAAIETTDMAPAPDGRDYQLWFAHADGSLTDAGVMPRVEDAAMVLSDDVDDAVGIGLTMEPAGGSAQPTTDPIVVIPIEA